MMSEDIYAKLRRLLRRKTKIAIYIYYSSSSSSRSGYCCCCTHQAYPSTDNNNNSTEITREGEVTFKTNKLTGKKKLVWTPTLHYKFLDAITIIGLNNAAPKKILEVMDVPGITRDHVASHLQKYRMLLRRVSELTMPASQRNYNVDWGFGSGVNLSPRIAAPRRYGGGMFSLINNLQTSLGGAAGRWNNNITAPMPPAGTFSSSSSFLFSDPPPRLAVASPPCNQPRWRPGYGTGGRQSSLLLSPHHHHQLFNFGLQIPAASTNMVDPIYQQSFTSLPPLVIPGNNDDAIAAASPPVPTLQLHGGGGGSSMLQPPPQTYNNNNATGGDETSSLKLPARLGLTAPLSTEFSMFDMMMSFFADDDDHQLDGGGLQATHEDLIRSNT